MMNPSSLLALCASEAEATVGRLRAEFDPTAREGLGAHITILFPFVPPAALSSDTVLTLEQLFSKHRQFNYRLYNVGRFPGTAYLVPEPAAPFVELTRTVVRHFPEYPPYEGLFSQIIPHLTVADCGAAVAENTERRLRELLITRGPIHATCSEVTLLQNVDGRWAKRHVFKLAHADLENIL